MTIEILYLVHDLNDAAVKRRLAFLKQSFHVKFIGFRRDTRDCSQPEEEGSICLGITRDAQLLHRLRSVFGSLLVIIPHLSILRRSQIIICRNLENAILAILWQSLFGLNAKVLFECLDIQRHLTGFGPLGIVLRVVERFVLKRVDAVLTSSPAFAEKYFLPSQKAKVPFLIVENKLSIETQEQSIPLVQRPVKIGFFGILRCRKSFDYLLDVSRRRPDLLKIQIAGRPFRDVFPDLESELHSGTRYLGPFKPEGIASLYETIQFSWAIDYFESGFNSCWLLPNRLYESLAFGRVPIAVEGTETAYFLRQRGVGLILEDIAELERVLSGLTSDEFADICRRIKNLDQQDLLFVAEDQRNLVEKIRVLSSSTA